MVATATKQKATRLFEMMDQDGNGHISQADFEQTADRLISSFENGDMDTIRRVQNSYLQAWRELALQADANSDGKVTREEFEQAFAGAPSSKMLSVVEDALQAEFELADKDGDGTLNADELRTMIKAFGVPEHEVSAAVSAFDLNGDGIVSRDEYMAAMREFYVSEDADSPHGTAFGRLQG